MSEYKDGWADGYKFAREEIMEKLSEIDINDIDFDTVSYDSDGISWLSSSVDRIEG